MKCLDILLKRSGASDAYHDDNRSWETWLERFVKASDFFCALPLRWDSLNKCLSKRRFPILWWLTTTSFTLDNFYQLHTSISLNYKSKTAEEIQKFAVHGSTRWVAALLLYALMSVGFAVDHLNEILSIHSNLKLSYYGKAYVLRNSDVTSFFILIYFVASLQPFFGPVLQFLLERHSFRYWGSHYVSRDLYDSTLGIILFTFNEFFISVMSTFAASYMGLIVYTYTVTTGFWLRTIVRIFATSSRSCRNIYETHAETDKMTNVSKNLKTYKLLSMQNRLHNAYFAPFIWPILQYVLITTHVGFNILVVKSQAWNFPAIYTFMLLLVEGVVLTFENNCFMGAAQMYELSCKFKKGLRQVNNKVVKRYSTSLRPLRVEVGSCYYFKMSTFTSFMKTLVDSTANVLLTAFN